jgi:hypothetical protein
MDEPFFVDMIYNVGLEFWLMDLIGLRTGYWNDELGQIKPRTAGVSIRTPIENTLDIRWDISYMEGSTLEGTERISLTIGMPVTMITAPQKPIFNRPQRLPSHLVVEGKAPANLVIPAPATPTILVEENIPTAKVINKDAVAVVIGNAHYSSHNRDLPDVEFASRDAAVMKEYLLKALGYQEGNILFHTDAGLAVFRDLFGTPEEPRGKLANIAKPGKSDVFIYYSGHGAPDVSEKKCYFVPVDCSPDAVSRNGYPLELLYQNIAQMEAHSVTVVIDACFSGGSSMGKMLIANASPGAIRLTDPTANWQNGSVFAACASDEIASWYPEMKHGLFTYFFLKGLQGGADADSNGQITAGELHLFVSDPTEGVPYEARRLYNGRKQTPKFYGREGQVLLER